jgi:hypothetical protein
VNKTDLHEEEYFDGGGAIARILRPRIIRSSYCRSEIDILAAAPRRPLEGEYALCRDPSFASVAVPLDAPLEIAPLLAELDRIKNDVYRVKGFVPVPDGVVYVDVAAGRLNHRKVGVPAEREDGGGRAGLVSSSIRGERRPRAIGFGRRAPGVDPQPV